MNDFHRNGDRSSNLDKATNFRTRTKVEHYGHSCARIMCAAPSLDIIAAVEFLLTQPDVHLYRRRYLDLIIYSRSTNGALTANYSVAEQYLLATASRCRQVGLIPRWLASDL